MLRATDLLLPRHKSVQVTENLARYQSEEQEQSLEPSALAQSAVFGVTRTYWGENRLNCGSLGFSTRLELWGEQQRLAVQQALAVWKRDVRPRIR